MRGRVHAHEARRAGPDDDLPEPDDMKQGHVPAVALANGEVMECLRENVRTTYLDVCA